MVWLPPFEVGTIIALGLELQRPRQGAVERAGPSPPKTSRWCSLKGPGAVIGHRGFTRRPAGVSFMHYECELAVVIGKPAHNARSGGRCSMWRATPRSCNDYAIRDYLENWYRPNLRVKTATAGTVLGRGWWMPRMCRPARSCPAHAGQRQVTQQGHTGNMINDIPALIEYLSGFMTLRPAT